jgi:hypothetical protein
MSLRPKPSGTLFDDHASAFTVLASGSGQLITFQDTQTPLRAFRWLPPLPGGVLAAQVLSQNDRQRVALFHDGAQDGLLVLKPVGVADGFWRSAALQAAAMVPGGTVLLLYQPGDPASAEPALALAVDVASQQVRWFCRGPFTRMAVAQGPDGAVYFYGGKSPIQRLALKAGGAGSLRPTPESIELGPDIPEVDDLLPTGADSFLVSHRNGLSVYRAGADWAQYPAPEADGPPCPGWKSSLVRDGKQVWWQPGPGKLLKVRPDGRPDALVQWTFRPEDPFALDAGLLRALGADSAGWIWFALATPAPPAPAAAPPNPPVEAEKGREAPAVAVAPAVPATDWGSYLAAGLDRLYRWNPNRGVLERVAMKQAWAVLNPPAPVQPPVLGRDVVPAAGTLLAEGAHCAWWLPLAALSLERVVQAKPAPAAHAQAQAM